MKPCVSVVVASYNYGRYVGEALASLRAQSFSDWEAVVVDDGSTDESLSVIDKFLRDDRFRLIRQSHAGQPRTKNAGVRASRGEFVAFLDADDRWHPRKLAKQLPIFANPEIGVVYSRRRFLDPDGHPGDVDRRPHHRGQVLDSMFRDNFVCFSSAVVRRSVFEHLGLFDERLAVAIDYDLWLRFSRHYEFDYVDEPLVDYRIGHVNLSRRVVDRLHTALAIMTRFRRRQGRHRLNKSTMTDAFADTYRHRALVGRGHDPDAAWADCWRALRLRPGDVANWRAVASSLIPAEVRSFARRVRGGADWERACRDPCNAAEVIA